MIISLVVIGLCIAVIVYHHAIYALIIKSKGKGQNSQSDLPEIDFDKAPRIGVFIAAHNEQEFIHDKLLNLAIQNYPLDKIAIHVMLDGCTDDTKAVTLQAMKALQQERVYCKLDEFEQNQGKVAALNYLIQHYKDDYDVVIFSDVSAVLSMDAFARVASKMMNSDTSVVSGIYQLFSPGSDNQQKYWQYQNNIRMAESELGAVIGVPGAMFAIRSDKLDVLPDSVINDDFVLSMAAQDAQHRASIDAEINIVEMEQDQQQDDFKRRIRIAAGNMQQVFLLKDKLQPKMGWLAFNFFSGKVLRAFMPMCFLVLYLAGFALAAQGFWPAQVTMVGLTLCHAIGLFKIATDHQLKLPVIDQVNYLVFSYFVGLVGVMNLIAGRYASPWQRLHSDKPITTSYVPVLKRALDVLGAAAGLVLLSPVMLLAAIAIKLDSKGPVLYRQLRVGRTSDKFVELIYVYKLRSMVQNAEQQSGAVWAGKNDPRITRVGKFLRKTRIDELPQFWNVLIGEMSLIGPRPERPAFYQKLEQQIPYFSQRTYMLKPGISGLAQVMNGYDETLEDAKNKIAWDYAYSLSTTNVASWSRMEWDILVRTIKIVLTGKGQ